MKPTNGMRTFQDSVKPHRWVSQLGIIRRPPSSQPTYQSGWASALTWAGLYGPTSQTGLMVMVADISTMTPLTAKKKPPALATYTGKNG